MATLLSPLPFPLPLPLFPLLGYFRVLWVFTSLKYGHFTWSNSTPTSISISIFSSTSTISTTWLYLGFEECSNRHNMATFLSPLPFPLSLPLPLFPLLGFFWVVRGFASFFSVHFHYFHYVAFSFVFFGRGGV